MTQLYGRVEISAPALLADPIAGIATYLRLALESAVSEGEPNWNTLQVEIGPKKERHDVLTVFVTADQKDT